MITIKDNPDGAIAQLGERLPCTQEVSSSIQLSSTIIYHLKTETKLNTSLNDDLSLVFTLH